MVTATVKRGRSLGQVFGAAWPLVLGFAALAIPTALDLANQTWTQEDGAQGPIVLATGGWILWRQLNEVKAPVKGGAGWLAGVLVAAALVSYIAGRMFDYMTLEAGGLFVVGVAMLYAKFGARILLAAWFPIFYLAFAVPLPGFVIDHLTAPLKHFAAMVSTDGLQAAGFPVARQGVTIMIAQYQLLVEDACSGMNSLIGLTAISLLYIYLMRRASPAYALLLTLFVIPIAIAANIVRITAILLITYAFGNEVGQSFIHMAAGLFLFATALLLVFALDQGLHPLFQKLAGRKA